MFEVPSKDTIMIQLTKRKIDPSVVEYPSVAALQVLKAVQDVRVECGLYLQPARGPLCLEETNSPQQWHPACLVWCPRSTS